MKQSKQWIKLLLVMALPGATAAAAPGLINYQGRLTDSAGTPVTAATNVTFTLWNAVSGGVQQGGGFSDTDVVTPDAHGLYSTEIGDDGGPVVPTSVFDSDAVWLNVNVAGEDLSPRLRITSAGYAADADTLQGKNAAAFLNMAADAYVVVQTTASATQNGTNLLAAYAAAKALTPAGAVRSATNRATVVVPPARYDLGAASLTLDADYVDIVGLTTSRDSQYVLSSGNVLIQSAAAASNVRIENLVLHYTGADPALFAYKPVGGSLAATFIRNCRFEATGYGSMVSGTSYAGTYINCVATSFNAFGGGGGGAASGTFTDCVALGAYCFGGGGTVSGTFTNCTGGSYAFGGSGGTVSGTFTNCTGGGVSFGGQYGTASGTFTNCTGGLESFASYGTASGKFINCVATGDYAFAGRASGNASGTFINCVAYGNYCFGGGGGTASGTFTGCTGAEQAFGGVGSASGTFASCTGGLTSFGGGGTAGGTFTDCTGASIAFGGGSDGIASGTFNHCTGGAFAFGGGGGSANGGKFYHCVGGLQAFTETGAVAPVQFFCIQDGALYSGNN